MASDVALPHGILLTGGRSTRMGADKAALDFGARPLAARVAGAMLEVAYPVVVVGPHAGLGLPIVEDAGVGPLGALVAGWQTLAAQGDRGPVIAVACDLPLVTSGLLRGIAEALGDAEASIPVLYGRDQPLAAAYSQPALIKAGRLLTQGARSMRSLVQELRVRRICEREWTEFAPQWSLFDVDTPDDLRQARRIAEAGTR